MKNQKTEQNAWEKHLNQMDEDEKEGWHEDGYSQLSREDQMAVGFAKLHGQVCNGGFLQFFGNGFGYLFDDLMEYSESLGLSQTLDVLKDVKDVLRDFYIDPCRYVQWERYSDQGDYEWVVDQFDKLSDRFYDGSDDEIKEAMVEFFSE